MSESTRKMPMSMVQAQQQIREANQAYDRALARIKQLEHKLLEKASALDKSLLEQDLLRKNLTQSITQMLGAADRLGSTQAELDNERLKIDSYIKALIEESREVELSNEAWAKKYIKLEFDMLTVREEINKVTAARNEAVDKMLVMEKELMSVKSENHRLKTEQRRDR